MKKTLLFSLSLFGQIGFGISLPLVVLGLLGRYFDRMLNTNPYLFLTGLALAMVITFFYLKRIVKEAIDSAEQLDSSTAESEIVEQSKRITIRE